MIGNILKNHELIKDISGQLKLAGITVNIRQDGDTLAKIGAGTSPFMLGIVGDVEVVDMEKAVDLAESLGFLD